MELNVNSNRNFKQVKNIKAKSRAFLSMNQCLITLDKKHNV